MRKHVLVWFILLLSTDALFGQQLPFIFVPGGPTHVQVLFEDHLGRLWVGGVDDVACFDGSRFYSLRDLGFPAVGVSSLTEDDQGAIWIGSDTGLYRFYAGTLQQMMRGQVVSLAIASGMALTSVRTVKQEPLQDPILFRIRWNGKEWQSDKIAPLPWPVPFTLDHAGNLLIPHSAGWGEASVEDLAAWHSGLPLPISRNHSAKAGFGIKFLRDRFACVWSRTLAFTSYQCPGDPEPVELPSFSGKRGAPNFSEDSRGTMIFVNVGGVVMGRPGNFKSASAQQGVPDVNGAIIATDGTVWLGGAKGIYHWSQPFRMEYWTAREGFAGTARIGRVGNKIFAGNGQEGIAALSADRNRWIPLPKSKALGLVFDLLPDLQGGMLAGLRLGGVAQVSVAGVVLKQAGRRLEWVSRLASDSSGRFWAAGTTISRVNLTKNHLSLEGEKIPDPGPLGQESLDIDFQQKTGKLWACWERVGLIHKEPTGWETVSTNDGLASNLCGSLVALPSGDVWAGYYDRQEYALVRLDSFGKATVKRFAPSKGENAQVMFLDTDSRGWLWRGTPDGVYVADSSDAEQNLWIRLGESDGLPNSEVNRESFYADADGSVWWLARDSSLLHFSPPADFVHPAFAPKVYISGFSWNRTAPRLAEAVSSLPARATVTAHLGSLQFDRRKALRLRYQLSPEQTAWRESQDLDVPLGVLGWGNHTLKVQAKLGAGPWSTSVAHEFIVLRPFWATWPFIISLAFVGTAAGVGGYRWKRQSERVKRRTLPDLNALRLDAMLPEAHGLLGVPLDARFLPKKVLARGGFATVFEGHDKKQNCRCAIKVFHREIADQGLAQRFAQEVAALETVVHPNVVRIYGHGETPIGVPYLVMEFVEGETLRAAIPRQGFPRREIARLLRQAGDALGAIHAHGICHRDLKPDNLMIRPNNPAGNELVLIDFSIAIVKSPDKTVHGLSRAAGTIQYMAPEQAVGWADASSDIYSLAKVVIEMMTGKRLSELLPDASRDLPVRVREFLQTMPSSALSAESIQLLGAALEFDPERRPRIAVEFAQTIARDLESANPLAAV